MDVDAVAAIAQGFDGVRESRAKGLRAWRFRGRLVARQVDDEHVVIRTGFADRDRLLRRAPTTFSVPQRFARHMMVVADFAAGEESAITDALYAAWQLQSEPD